MDKPILSILQPDGVSIKVFEVGEKLIPTPEEIPYKFDTCSYRSKEQVEHTKRSCCSVHILKGFKCLRFDIIPLKPEQCVACPEYKP